LVRSGRISAAAQGRFSSLSRQAHRSGLVGNSGLGQSARRRLDTKAPP
jgi:hypothetical protein